MTMNRIDALKAISDILSDELVVCNIGIPSKELYSVRDRPENFYMLGSMGMASSIGLGLALSQPRTVVVFDGDGAILMNMGSLATISYYRPENYKLIIFDNAAYGSTGSQTTLAEKVEIADIVKGCGLRCEVLSTEDELINILPDQLIVQEPLVFIVKISKINAKLPPIDKTPEEIKNRFMNIIGK
jgi:sulfopyruvate decarboxylase subunit beta